MINIIFCCIVINKVLDTKDELFITKLRRTIAGQNRKLSLLRYERKKDLFIRRLDT